MSNKVCIMKKVTIILVVALVLQCLSCRSDRIIAPTRTVEKLPKAPVYSDNSQWFVVDRQAPVDLFYIVSTETGDYIMDGLPCHYADTYSDSTRQLLWGEMVGVDEIMSGGLNYYSPYYRQCTLQTFTSDSLMQQRLPLAMRDVKHAFDYYLAHLNGGRPFVLAGFSQGGMAVVELLKQMDSDAFNRMVAAYVIGWRITDDDLARPNHFRPAQDSADVGVTVCYNSVRDNSCAIPMISGGNRMAINPVNWRTDTTPATLVSPISTNPESGLPDTVIVTLDTNTLLLNVSGYSRTDYILPLIGREGNYHSLEISLYRNCLRRNVSLRAERYLAKTRH